MKSSTSGVTCWLASLQAASGLQWLSTIKPSKPKSIACWQSGAMSSRLPPIWLGSPKMGRPGQRRRNSMGICHIGRLRSSPPIQSSKSGLTGFLTNTGISTPFKVSAISCIAKGFATVRAPIHSKSTPAFKQASTWAWVATSVQTFMPSSFCTRFNHARPSSPTPSKPPGFVRGFQMPARKSLTPFFESCVAVFITCSSVSAEQGPAITIGRLSSCSVKLSGVMLSSILF